MSFFNVVKGFEYWKPCIGTTKENDLKRRHDIIGKYNLCSIVDDVDNKKIRVLYCPNGKCVTKENCYTQKCISHKNLKVDPKPYSTVSASGYVYKATDAFNNGFKFALKVPKLKEQLLANKNSKVKNDKLCKEANTSTLHELLVGIEMNKMIKELDSPHFIYTYGYRCSNDYTQCKEQIVYEIAIEQVENSITLTNLLQNQKITEQEYLSVIAQIIFGLGEAQDSRFAFNHFDCHTDNILLSRKSFNRNYKHLTGKYEYYVESTLLVKFIDYGLSSINVEEKYRIAQTNISYLFFGCTSSLLWDIFRFCAEVFRTHFILKNKNEKTASIIKLLENLVTFIIKICDKKFKIEEFKKITQVENLNFKELGLFCIKYITLLSNNDRFDGSNTIYKIVYDIISGIKRTEKDYVNTRKRQEKIKENKEKEKKSVQEEKEKKSVQEEKEKKSVQEEKEKESVQEEKEKESVQEEKKGEESVEVVQEEKSVESVESVQEEEEEYNNFPELPSDIVLEKLSSRKHPEDVVFDTLFVHSVPKQIKYQKLLDCFASTSHATLTDILNLPHSATFAVNYSPLNIPDFKYDLARNQPELLFLARQSRFNLPDLLKVAVKTENNPLMTEKSKKKTYIEHDEKRSIRNVFITRRCLIPEMHPQGNQENHQEKKKKKVVKIVQDNNYENDFSEDEDEEGEEGEEEEDYVESEELPHLVQQVEEGVDRCKFKDCKNRKMDDSLWCPIHRCSCKKRDNSRCTKRVQSDYSKFCQIHLKKCNEPYSFIQRIDIQHQDPFISETIIPRKEKPYISQKTFLKKLYKENKNPVNNSINAIAENLEDFIVNEEEDEENEETTIKERIQESDKYKFNVWHLDTNPKHPVHKHIASFDSTIRFFRCFDIKDDGEFKLQNLISLFRKFDQVQIGIRIHSKGFTVISRIYPECPVVEEEEEEESSVCVVHHPLSPYMLLESLHPEDEKVARKINWARQRRLVPVLTQGEQKSLRRLPLFCFGDEQCNGRSVISNISNMCGTTRPTNMSHNLFISKKTWSQIQKVWKATPSETSTFQLSSEDYELSLNSTILGEPLCEYTSPFAGLIVKSAMSETTWQSIVKCILTKHIQRYILVESQSVTILKRVVEEETEVPPNIGKKITKAKSLYELKLVFATAGLDVQILTWKQLKKNTPI
jgi:hypothetical protein